MSSREVTMSTITREGTLTSEGTLTREERITTGRMGEVIVKTFKQSNSEERRKQLSQKVLSQNKKCVPVIVERHPGSNLPQIEKRK